MNLLLRIGGLLGRSLPGDLQLCLDQLYGEATAGRGERPAEEAARGVATGERGGPGGAPRKVVSAPVRRKLVRWMISKTSPLQPCRPVVSAVPGAPALDAGWAEAGSTGPCGWTTANRGSLSASQIDEGQP